MGKDLSQQWTLFYWKEFPAKSNHLCVYVSIFSILSIEVYIFFYYNGIIKLFALLTTYMSSPVGHVRFNVNSNVDFLDFILDFRWCICLIQKFYQVHAKTKSRDRVDNFEKFAHLTENIFKSIMLSLVSTLMLFCAYIICMYFIHGEIIPILNLFFPGIDEKTLIAYVLLNLYQLFVCLSVAFVWVHLSF